MAATVLNLGAMQAAAVMQAPAPSLTALLVSSDEAPPAARRQPADAKQQRSTAAASPSSSKATAGAVAVTAAKVAKPAKCKNRIRRERLEGMQRVADAKLAELQRLQHERQRLEVRHALLLALVEAMGVIRNWLAGGAESGWSTAAASDARATSEEEAQLLSQLERLPRMVSSGGSGGGGGGGATDGRAGSDDDRGDADDEPRPIAPVDDPLLLIRELRGRPMRADPTLAQVQQLHGAAVRDMALHLQLLESGAWQCGGGSGDGGDGGSASSGSGSGSGGSGGGSTGAAAAPPHAAAAAAPSLHEYVRAAVLDHLRLLGGICHRGELATALQLTSALTGERVPAVDERRHRWLLAQLRLSPTQLRRIAAGTGVVRELHGRILAQLRTAQAEYAAAAEAAAGEAAAAAAAGGDGFGGGLGRSGSQALEAHLGRLERQDSSRARVEALLRREWQLRSAASAFFFGCLTYEQVAKAMVLFWPHFFTATLLMRLVEEQQQQQDQQDQQEQARQQQQQGQQHHQGRPRQKRAAPSKDEEEGEASGAC